MALTLEVVLRAVDAEGNISYETTRPVKIRFASPEKQSEQLQECGGRANMTKIREFVIDDVAESVKNGVSFKEMVEELMNKEGSWDFAKPDARG